MIIKIISFGLILDENTYLKDPWSILDFIIVFFSIVDIALASYNLSYIKVINLLSCLSGFLIDLTAKSLILCHLND